MAHVFSQEWQIIIVNLTRFKRSLVQGDFRVAYDVRKRRQEDSRVSRLAAGNLPDCPLFGDSILAVAAAWFCWLGL